VEREMARSITIPLMSSALQSARGKLRQSTATNS
jgi:hypothetical protein